jgi:hypothetical protein
MSLSQGSGFPLTNSPLRLVETLDECVDIIYHDQLEITSITVALSLRTLSAGILRYSPECVEVEFSEVSLKSKDWNFLRSRPSISAMLGMYVKWTTRRQVGCLAIS